MMRLKPQTLRSVCVGMLLAAALNAQTPAAQPREPKADSALTILRTQLAEMRDYREDILSTVHWALGIAGAVAFLLVGYSWFTNSRNYERDKENMLAALKNELAAEYRVLGDELREEHKNRGEQLEALATKAARGEVGKVSSDLSSLRTKLVEVNEEVIELQIQDAEERKWAWVVLTKRLELLEMRRKDGWEMRVADQLEKLSELLHMPWFELDADEAARVMTAMEKLHSSHSADAEAIRARVRKLRTPDTAASS